MYLLPSQLLFFLLSHVSLLLHVELLPFIFTHFILLLYSLDLFFALFSCFMLFPFTAKYTFIVHFNHGCAFTTHFAPVFSYFCYYYASPPYLGFSSKLYPKFLVQHAPNTHLWLVPSHSGLLLRASPYFHKLLGIVFCCCDLFPDFYFLFHNIFYDLCSQGHKFFFVIM
jgi:hypothetical protein